MTLNPKSRSQNLEPVLKPLKPVLKPLKSTFLDRAKNYKVDYFESEFEKNSLKSVPQSVVHVVHGVQSVVQVT